MANRALPFLLVSRPGNGCGAARAIDFVQRMRPILALAALIAFSGANSRRARRPGLAGETQNRQGACPPGKVVGLRCRAAWCQAELSSVGDTNRHEKSLVV
jgi:hypothetical protein